MRPGTCSGISLLGMVIRFYGSVDYKMKMIHSIALLCLFLLFANLLLAESWTVLVYMAADNNLAEMGKLDINSMESVDQPVNLNLIVQADFPEGAKRYKVQKDNSGLITSPVIGNLGSIDSGNPQTLKQFMAWGFAAYPSERKMLVIWSHGDSWYKGKDKWICPDEGSENLMSVANGDLAIAFSGTPHLDVLLFDACSMQSIEVITEVADYTDYVIGSEELVPQYGYPYERIIPLFAEPLNNLLEQVPQLYVLSYQPGEGINPGPGQWTATCSVIATANLNTFLDSFQAAIHQMLLEGTHYHSLRSDCYEFNTGLADVDLRQFATLLHEYRPTWPVFSQLLDSWNSMLVSSDYSTIEGNIANIGTAALWYPDNRFNFENSWPQYIKLKFAQNWWPGYLNYVLGDTEPPATPVLLSQKVEKRILKLELGLPVRPDFMDVKVILNNDGIPRIYSCVRYASSLSIAIPIEKSGSYVITLEDFSGNASTPLTGAFHLPAYCQVAPNPVAGKGLATLNWWNSEDSKGEVKLDVYNLRGQLVFSKKLDSPKGSEGSYLLSSDPSFLKLAAGRYYVNLRLGVNDIRSAFTILY